MIHKLILYNVQPQQGYVRLSNLTGKQTQMRVLFTIRAPVDTSSLKNFYKIQNCDIFLHSLEIFEYFFVYSLLVFLILVRYYTHWETGLMRKIIFGGFLCGLT